MSNENIGWIKNSVKKMKEPGGTFGLRGTLSALREIASESRIDFVAKIGSDVILFAKQDCMVRMMGDGCLDSPSKVKMVGWSMGAHTAFRSCEFVRNNIGMGMVEMLHGLDPANVRLVTSLGKSRYIKKGMATYTQVRLAFIIF